MKNKNILLGILAVFIIIFVLYGYFYSSFFSNYKEGLADPLDPNIQNIIVGLINARISPDNPDGNLTDDNIIANITLLGSSNSQITDVLASNITSKEAVDRFASLFGQGIYDPLVDGLVIHYTFDSVKTIGGQEVIENKSYNWVPSNPNKYNAVIHKGANNPQPIDTIIDKTNTAVNPSCLNLAGLPRGDPKANGSTDNGAYLMIPTIPTCYNSTGFLGMTFSLWFLATEQNGNWTCMFDFGNNQDSDNLLLTSSENNSQCLGALMINNAWNPWEFYKGDYVCDANWRHVVWAISKKGVWTIYMNNQVVSNNIGLHPTNIVRKRNYIGKSNWNSDNDMFNGKIDDFRMYQRELLPEEVGMLYAKGGKVQQKNNQFWVMPDTLNQWYNNNQGIRNMGKINDLGILSNIRMTIAFWMNIANTSSNWRNIFLISNNGTDGSRVPSLYIYPGQTRLHFRFATQYSWNAGIGPDSADPTYALELGKDTHITFTINNTTINFYVNGVEKLSGTLSSGHRYVNNTSAASLYMAAYSNCENVKLKNLQIFNRPLSNSEVMDVYNQVVCTY